MFAAGQGNNVQVVDICSGFKLDKPFVTESPVECLECFENLLITGCSNGTLLVCDNDVKSNVYGMKLFEQKPVSMIEFNRDHSKLVVGSSVTSPCVLDF